MRTALGAPPPQSGALGPTAAAAAAAALRSNLPTCARPPAPNHNGQLMHPRTTQRPHARLLCSRALSRALSTVTSRAHTAAPAPHPGPGATNNDDGGPKQGAAAAGADTDTPITLFIQIMALVSAVGGMLFGSVRSHACAVCAPRGTPTRHAARGWAWAGVGRCGPAGVAGASPGPARRPLGHAARRRSAACATCPDGKQTQRRLRHVT